jgi:thioesterase domain-containing protein/acyl carrier protein
MNARVEISDDLLELELTEIWRRLLKRDDVGLDEDFFDAGGDSLAAVQMMIEVESLAGDRPYPASELGNVTIRRIAQVLKSGMPAERGCATQAKAGSGSRLPLFFCHGDYQARGIYAHQLAALLPEEQPVYLLHPELEPPAGTTAEELAGRYVEEVRRIAPGMPVILGGYCNGGYVAWHLAHLLRARGAKVAALFLVDTPSINAWRTVRLVSSLLRATPRVQEIAMRALRNAYRHGARNFAARLLREARERLRGPRAPSAERSWWTLIRGMSARYVPPPLDVDVYCFRAEEGDRRETEPAHWRALAPRVTEMRVPGTHLSAVIAHRRALAAAIAAALNQSCAKPR